MDSRQPVEIRVDFTSPLCVSVSNFLFLPAHRIGGHFKSEYQALVFSNDMQAEADEMMGRVGGPSMSASVNCRASEKEALLSD